MTKRGFTLIEASASLLIISIVLVTAMAILMDSHRNTLANKERLAAHQVANAIRTDVMSNVSYTQLNTWLNGSENTVNASDCSSTPIPCAVFDYTANSIAFEESIQISFEAPNTTYQLVRFTITITYFNNERSITIGGVISA